MPVLGIAGHPPRMKVLFQYQSEFLPVNMTTDLHSRRSQAFLLPLGDGLVLRTQVRLRGHPSRASVFLNSGGFAKILNLPTLGGCLLLRPGAYRIIWLVRPFEETRNTLSKTNSAS